MIEFFKSICVLKFNKGVKMKHFYLFTVLLISLILSPIKAQNFWEKTNAPSIFFRSLAINSDREIFAGSSGSIYHSTNSGDSWEQVNNGISSNWVRSLIINSNVVFAGIDGNGVFRSSNNGNSWEHVFEASINAYCMAVNSNGDLFVGGDDSQKLGFLIRSTNNGNNWEKLEGQLNHSMQNFIFSSLVINSDDYIFAGTNDGIYHSTNYGSSWEEVNNGLTNINTLALAINSKGDIFAGTNGGGVYRSINNGNNWELVNYGTSFSTVNALLINSNDDIFAGTKNNGIYRSTHNGNGWEQLNDGLTISLINCLAINTQGYIFAGGGGTGGIFRSISTTIPPDKPILEFPADNDFNVSINPFLSWKPVFGATSFHLQVFKEGNILVFENSDIASTNVQIGPLEYESKYIWFVSAINNVGEGPVSESFTFTTKSPPSMTVASPNGGENWQVGSSHNITWVSNDVDSIKIEYTKDNGTNWINIVKSTPSDGSYDWTIPNNPSLNCKVRIIDAVNSSVTDESDNIFTISLSPNPTITVTFPNGGENWQVGSLHKITWVSNDVDSVKIEYSKDNGANWINIVKSTPSDGSYDWIIPNNPSLNCKARIIDAENNEVTDESDNIFIISLPPNPTITVTSPNGGENWQVGSLHKITWITNDVESVKIEYTKNNGTNWINVVQSTPSDGSYDWTIPNNPSSNCKVRIIDAANSAVKDESDNIFTISLPNFLIVDGDIGDLMYTNAVSKLNSNHGFGSNIDIKKIVCYSDTMLKKFFIGIEGKLNTESDDGIGLWLGFNEVNGLAAGTSLGGETGGHYMSNDASDNNFKADFEVDYMIALNPGKTNTNVYLDAAGLIGNRLCNSFGICSQNGVAHCDTPSLGLFATYPIEFAFNNSGIENKGFEISIPFGALGISEIKSLQVFAFIVSSTGYFSDVTIPGNVSSNSGFNPDFYKMTGGPFHTGLEIVDVKEKDNLYIPTAYMLEQNYPNPFNPRTIIQYIIPFSSNIELEIYNIFGQRITILVSRWQEAGNYNYTWNAENLASGVYLCRLIAKNSERVFEQTKKFNSIEVMLCTAG